MQVLKAETAREEQRDSRGLSPKLYYNELANYLYKSNNCKQKNEILRTNIRYS